MSRERSYPCSNPASHAICTKRAYLHKWKCMEYSCTYTQKSLADSTSSLLLNSSPNLSNLVKRMSQATTRLAPNTTGSHHKTSWDRQPLRQGQGRRSRCACQSSCTHRKRNIPVKACEASESKAPLSEDPMTYQRSYKTPEDHPDISRQDPHKDRQSPAGSHRVELHAEPSGDGDWLGALPGDPSQWQSLPKAWDKMEQDGKGRFGRNMNEQHRTAGLKISLHQARPCKTVSISKCQKSVGGLWPSSCE